MRNPDKANVVARDLNVFITYPDDEMDLLSSGRRRDRDRDVDETESDAAFPNGAHTDLSLRTGKLRGNLTMQAVLLRR
jgi:hypothetical protein